MKRTSYLGIVAALLFLSTTEAQAVVPVPDVAHFPLDELTGGGTTTPNLVAGGDDAVWFGDPGSNELGAGIVNRGSVTDDTDGGNGNEHYRVDLDGLVGSRQATFSMWFNLNQGPNSNSSYQGLFMTRQFDFQRDDSTVLTNQNWGLALRNGNAPYRIDTRVNGHGAANMTDIPADTWTHVALTWDGDTGQRITYLNGVVEDDQTDTNDIGTITRADEIRLSDDACCGGRELTGTTDDVAVWSSVLDATTIMELYNNGLNRIDASGNVAPKFGDVDLDDDTDLIDFEAIRANLFRDFGETEVTRADGDLNGDGLVNFVDYREWKTEYDSENQPASFAVPEPASASLFLLSMMGLAISRRRV